jgi:hypothetical protein
MMMIPKSLYNEIAKLPFYARAIFFIVGLFIISMMLYITWKIIVFVYP